MATRLRISEQEYKRLRALGKTKEEILSRYSTTSKSPLVGAAESITNFLGLRGVVDTLGTNLANIGVALDPKTSLKEKVSISKELPQTTLKQNIGAGVQLGSLVAPGAGLRVPLAKAVGGGAVLGASALGGQAAAEDKGVGTIAKQAAIGGALGAGTTLAVR